jgi:MFS family permease
MAFTAFALGGFYAALAPGLLSKRLQVSDYSVIGAVVALFFAAGSATIVVTRAMKSRTALFVASAFLIAGLALLLLADAAQSMAWLLVASIVTGAAMALGYRSSLEIINEIAPGEQRAEVVSTFLLVCYTANAIPVIGVGLLALAIGPENAHRVFAGVLAALGIVACAIGARYLPRR